MSDASTDPTAEPMSLERKRELLGLCNLGREALESEPSPDPPPAPLGASLSPQAIELLSTYPEGQGRLRSMGIEPVPTGFRNPALYSPTPRNT